MNVRERVLTLRLLEKLKDHPLPSYLESVKQKGN